jgi:mRNA interferase RelE/StbE
MAAYKVFFKKLVQKDLSAIPKKDLRRILSRIRTLSDDPRPAGCERLAGGERYRLRQGRYRVLYSIQDDKLTVWMVKIAPRKDVYR